MYRVHLFYELCSITKAEWFCGKRILEIGPNDGLDSKRLASLGPSQLVMIELPSKHQGNVKWLPDIKCSHNFIEANFAYMKESILGRFDLIWCTGVLYHNAEQMRFLRKLYKLLNVGGYLVLESATLRKKTLQDGRFVEIYYPQTFRDPSTITHLPTASAIKAWLQMVGFREIYDSKCYEKGNKDLIRQRMACICRKNAEDEGGVYYNYPGNPSYRYGDST
jgi:SAM-dependent methyltransferase